MSYIDPSVFGELKDELELLREDMEHQKSVCLTLRREKRELQEQIDSSPASRHAQLQAKHRELELENSKLRAENLKLRANLKATADEFRHRMSISKQKAAMVLKGAHAKVLGILADVKEGFPTSESGTIGKPRSIGFTDDDHRYFSRLNIHEEQPGSGRLPAASTVTRETDLAGNPHSTSEDRRRSVTSLTTPSIRGRLPIPSLKQEPNSPPTSLMTDQEPSFEKQPKLAPADRQPPLQTPPAAGPSYPSTGPSVQPAPMATARSLKRGADESFEEGTGLFAPRKKPTSNALITTASSDPDPSLRMSASSTSFSLPIKPDQVDMDDESPPFSTKEDDLDTEEL
ncbi:MAG: hypothetical protein Q9210_006139 [Variospora velana]